jgi:hypothetical protein
MCSPIQIEKLKCKNVLHLSFISVASTGIEPVSGASETLILSIVLRGRGHHGGLKKLVLNRTI